MSIAGSQNLPSACYTCSCQPASAVTAPPWYSGTISSPRVPMARLLRSFSSAFAWLLVTALMAPSAAVAQSYEQPPAHVSIAEGAVILERDGKTEASPASMPLLAGDRVRTQSGRAEILFADSSTLHL